MNTLKSLAIFAVILALGVTARAADVVINTGNTPGTYYLKVTVASDGSATVSPLSQVYNLVNPTPGPGPGPIIPPEPTPLTARGKAIQAAAEKVTDPNREDTAQALAMLYRELGKQVRIGKIADVQSLQTAVKMGGDMLLTGKTAPWQPVRDLLSTQWAGVTAQGGKVADYGVLLEEAANGLDASAPSKAIKPETLALILKIIEIVMALLIK